MSRLVIAASLFALTMSPLVAAQPPAATEQAHPSTTAHANASAGQASATRIEACLEATDAFIDQLGAGDYAAATGNFDAKMKAALSADKLGSLWQSVTAQFGKMESRSAPQNVIYQGFAVVTVPLQFEKGKLGARLACDADGKFAGFHIVPAAPAASG